jgi:hypothetical protein
VEDRTLEKPSKRTGFATARRARGRGRGGSESRATNRVLALDLDLLERGGGGVGGHGGAGQPEMTRERAGRAQRTGDTAGEEAGGGASNQVRCGHPLFSFA